MGTLGGGLGHGGDTEGGHWGTLGTLGGDWDPVGTLGETQGRDGEREEERDGEVEEEGWMEGMRRRRRDEGGREGGTGEKEG